MLLTIGELALAIGVSVVTVRRWDKRGLVKPHLRTVGGHRRYILRAVLEALGADNSDSQIEGKRLCVGMLGYHAPINNAIWRGKKSVWSAI